MSRGRFRTVIIVFVSMFIITGAGMFTNILLDNMERTLLSRTGRTMVRQAGIGKSEDAGKSADVTYYTGDVNISIKDRFNILSSWADADKSIPHEPMAGQMKEQQAVSVGKKWIDKMVKNEYILLDNHEENELKVESAELSTVYYSINVDEERFLSMWNISYLYGGDNRITVSIHALTGEVWRTLATTYSSKGKWQKEEYEDIIRSSYDYIFNENSDENTVSYSENMTVDLEARSENEDEDTVHPEIDEEELYSKMKESGNAVEIYNRDNWIITEYESNYYNSLNSYLEKKSEEKGEEDNSYYMQTFSMKYDGDCDIGFRVSKAEQTYENGFYIGFEMLMMPASMLNQIVEGFNVNSSIFDK